jgi:hypothetical protein
MRQRAPALPTCPGPPMGKDMPRTTTHEPRHRRALRWMILGACLSAAAGSAAPRSAAATAAPQPECSHYSGSGIPAGSGIPPWGFHATQALPGGRSGYAHGWGNIDLDASTISGSICQYVSRPSAATRAIAVRLGPRISYHTHEGHMWGYAGNIVITNVTVTASSDPTCAVGTHGHVTMYASYDGVRSDSIHFVFATGCPDERTLYHGAAVDAQVPPL